MATFEERRQAKLERAERFAASARDRGRASVRQGDAMLERIPFGQPLLVDHHSYRRDVSYRERARNKIDRGYQDLDRAAKWERRAAAIESDHAISSWDPDAAAKIRERIGALEAKRARIKAVNAAVRKHGIGAPELSEREREELLRLQALTPYHRPLERGFPAYALTNLGGNIRRLRERLVSLERAAERAPGRFVKAVPNKWPGRCEDCGAKVEARAGFYASDADGDAGVYCAECAGKED